MNHNEPGREPTEPTDAAVLMRLAFEIAAAERGISNVEEGKRALDAVIARGREYLSGQRPMPPVNSLSRAEVLKALTDTLLKAEAERMPDTPAPDEVAQLRAEVTEQSATIARQFELLKDIANVLNGQAGETELWSHADLPEMATRLTARVAELEAELAAMRPVYAAAKDYAQCCKDGTLGQVGAKDELLWLFHGYKLAQPAPGKEPTSE